MIFFRGHLWSSSVLRISEVKQKQTRTKCYADGHENDDFDTTTASNVEAFP